MALSDAEQIELIQLLEIERAVKAQGDLGEYAEQVLEVKPARHHRLLIAALHELERNGADITIVLMPPGSAKSTYGSVAFPAWYLGRNPTHCVIAASHTQELADRFGRKVRNLVGSEVHQRVFHEAGLAPDLAAMGRWETKQGGEYFAAGVGGAITGRRADLAIIDDPVKSREDADSETIRDKQWAWWRDDLTTRLKPNARILLIMTRWHEDDLGGRVLEDAKTSGKRVRIIKLPMEAGQDDLLGRKPGEMLWPEWFTPEMVATAKREPRTWSALYQQEPAPIGGGEFKLAWLLHYQRQPAVGQRVILVDPSSGKQKKRNDFTSMWVVGVGADGNDYVLDGVRDRLNLAERTDTLFDLVRKWKPSLVAYEEYGLQADIEHIKIEQERQQWRFRIEPIGGGLKKEDRIRRLIPRFQQGKIWLPQALRRPGNAAPQIDVVADFIDEYKHFPVATHDDAIDNLSRIEEPIVRAQLKAPSHDAVSRAAPMVRPFQPAVAGTGM